MKWGALIGWGIMIYAVMYLLWNGLVLYGFVEGFAPRTLSLIVLIVIAMIAARSLRYSNARDIAPYSLTWALVVILLDVVYTVPFAGWGMFSDWNVWVGYTLVALVPMLTPYFLRVRALNHV